MNDQTWNVQKIRQEIYDARTKLFVVAKVLEAGSVKIGEQQEWALVVRPLLKDILTYVDKIQGFLEEKPS
ncbi:MAG: hypothetical protein ACLQT6_14075 [Desulfomonilaceae bacterium]|jgi:hypothetical protein|nr:hypothetical protein [Syntrophaceae bacterium]